MDEEAETSNVSKPVSDQGSCEENVNINEDESTKRLLETLSSPAEDIDDIPADNTEDTSINLNPNVSSNDQDSSGKNTKVADEDLENSAIFQEIEKIHGGLERPPVVKNDEDEELAEPANTAADADNDDPLLHDNEPEKEEDEKDKTSQDDTIEHVNLDAGEVEETGDQTQEYVSVPNDNVVDEDAGGESSTKALETADVLNENDDGEIQAENPLSPGDNSEKDQADVDKDKNDTVDEVGDVDPIATDSFISENIEGADEELCIVPDSNRVVSQEEKDSEVGIPPLCVISQATSATEEELPLVAAMPMEVDEDSDKYVISKATIEDLQKCLQCVLQRKVKYSVRKTGEDEAYICNDTCLEAFQVKNPDKYILNCEGEIRVKDLTNPVDASKSVYERTCVVCKKKTDDEENNLTWEIMDFCNEFCLSKYQKEIGSTCAYCKQDVQPNSLGKYCVRFGNDIKQFCTCSCLEQYKKGLKVCSYCQQDMSSSEGFLAPVGDKGQFKDFCSQKCMEKYDTIKERPPVVPEGTKCSVCKAENPITIEYEFDGTKNYFCSDRCFVAFNFVNNINPSKCSMCRRYFPKEVLEKNTMFYDNVHHSFCTNSCQNVYIIAHRKIVPCVWCKVKKYNFDMIRRYIKTGPVLNMCSINCLSLFQVSVNAVHSKRTVCNFCNTMKQPMYHLTMSDATIRDFCSYSCVMAFQNKFKKSPIHLHPVPAGEPKKSRKFDQTTAARSEGPTLPVISSVQSLASNQNGNYSSQQNTGSQVVRTTMGRPKKNSVAQVQSEPTPPPEPQTKMKHIIIIKPAPVPSQRNMGVNCRVRQNHKTTMMKPTTVDKGIQTDEREPEKILIPVPIPMYMPSPLPMYSIPAPIPLPFPLPIPVPIFIPTTRNSAKGIMKEIKKIQVKIPTDPYEAELLMMAEMVAGDKKEDNTDSESEVEEEGPADEGSFSPEPPDASNTFGDDMLQMALKMATELEEPAVDLEGALTANTITAPQGSEGTPEEPVDESQPLIQHIPERQPSGRGRKRGRGRGAGAAKRRRMSSQQVEVPVMPPQAIPPEVQEKPDAHLCLKYTFGVNAWKQWVTTKNTEMEKASKFPKLFKTEILQMTSDELNYSLCLFVKEVRKPNGAEYAPDTIYYLCLGIQQYLFENNRIDNIFCDPYYEQFTYSLDEVAKKFSVLYNDSHYIVTRVEEEHLWESKQLGAHSPHVLLSTLMFFNTKHFNLTTVQEHMQLSFSHIMKHWKRNPAQAGVARVPGSRNVLLRFYPPQAAMQNNTRKKKVYEQQENDENPLRCPVKLYEFYLSKCPESVKTRNDVFYLQPERSCVPDSPVWYSTTALPQEALEKMLHRVKMVKEINVALLTS